MFYELEESACCSIEKLAIQNEAGFKAAGSPWRWTLNPWYLLRFEHEIDPRSNHSSCLRYPMQFLHVACYECTGGLARHVRGLCESRATKRKNLLDSQNQPLRSLASYSESFLASYRPATMPHDMHNSAPSPWFDRGLPQGNRQKIRAYVGAMLSAPTRPRARLGDSWLESRETACHGPRPQL